MSYLTDVGTFQGTITATVGLGSADSFGGAQLTALDLDTALVRFGTDGKVDAIDIKVAEGADVAQVQRAIAEVLPPRTEVITGEQSAQETADAVNEFVGIFGTGLLVFAFITAFVSAFIINNVFQISIGQRLPRARPAPGGRRLGTPGAAPDHAGGTRARRSSARWPVSSAASSSLEVSSSCSTRPAPDSRTPRSSCCHGPS